MKNLFLLAALLLLSCDTTAEVEQVDFALSGKQRCYYKVLRRSGDKLHAISGSYYVASAIGCRDTVQQNFETGGFTFYDRCMGMDCEVSAADCVAVYWQYDDATSVLGYHDSHGVLCDDFFAASPDRNRAYDRFGYSCGHEYLRD